MNEKRKDRLTAPRQAAPQTPQQAAPQTPQQAAPQAPRQAAPQPPRKAAKTNVTPSAAARRAATKPRRGPRRRVEPVEIPVIGELFEEGESEIVRSILEVPLGNPAIFYIDSAGGSVYAALTISSLIRYRRIDATAVVLGECSSSALLIFAVCQRRLVTPRSIFLFHRVKWRSEKDVQSEEAASWAVHFRWLEDEIDRYQAELLGADRSRFVDWIRESRFVNGPEMVEAGFAELLDI